MRPLDFQKELGWLGLLGFSDDSEPEIAIDS